LQSFSVTTQSRFVTFCHFLRSLNQLLGGVMRMCCVHQFLIKTPGYYSVIIQKLHPK
jgi:hypothetical protein